jgi:hypothetical protein
MTAELKLRASRDAATAADTRPFVRLVAVDVRRLTVAASAVGRP